MRVRGGSQVSGGLPGQAAPSTGERGLGAARAGHKEGSATNAEIGKTRQLHRDYWSIIGRSILEEPAFWSKHLKPLALPRGIEPLFQPLEDQVDPLDDHP